MQTIGTTCPNRFMFCPLCGSKHLASREEERKGHFDPIVIWRNGVTASTRHERKVHFAPIVNLLRLNEFGQDDRIESTTQRKRFGRFDQVVELLKIQGFCNRVRFCALFWPIISALRLICDDLDILSKSWTCCNYSVFWTALEIGRRLGVAICDALWSVIT